MQVIHLVWIQSQNWIQSQIISFTQENTDLIHIDQTYCSWVTIRRIQWKVLWKVLSTASLRVSRFSQRSKTHSCSLFLTDLIYLDEHRSGNYVVRLAFPRLLSRSLILHIVLEKQHSAALFFGKNWHVNNLDWMTPCSHLSAAKKMGCVW